MCATPFRQGIPKNQRPISLRRPRFPSDSTQKDSLELPCLGDDGVKGRMKAGRFPLPHLGENGDLILPAGTEELRKFMQGHAEDKEALAEESKLVREK